MKSEKYQYEYDEDIYKDEDAVKIYRELAPQTRWRVGNRTQIEPIRMNALKQFVAMGTPTYNGHIYYADTGSVLECGEILPFEIFRLFSDIPEVKRLYIFPYPFRNEKEQPVYFSFEPTETAREEMRKYLRKKFEEAYQIEESISANVIPDVKELNSCIINELITKIYVGDKHRVNGEKVQSIEIHYRFIGNLTDGGMEQVNKKSS